MQSELNLNLSKPNSRNSDEYCTFDKSFVEVLGKYSPKKRKCLSGNHKPHVNKTLSKVLEKVMYEQLYEYLNNYLNDLLFGFH